MSARLHVDRNTLILKGSKTAKTDLKLKFNSYDNLNVTLVEGCK